MHISSMREGRVARADPAEVRDQEWIEETEDGTTITASTESVICQDLGNLSFINIYTVYYTVVDFEWTSLSVKNNK